MPSTLCFLVCQNFAQEIASSIAAEGWPDVVHAVFPARCGRPPIAWDEFRDLLPQGCSQVLVFGRVCLGGLGPAPADFPPIRLILQEQCFHVVAGNTLVAEAIAGGAYLMTPGWLKNWRAQLAKMGFSPETAGEFFRGFARQLVLLDTGIDPEANTHLEELAKVTGLPARHIALGLDHTRLLLTREVLEWRLAEQRRSADELAKRHARKLGDHVMTIDQLAALAKIGLETEIIAHIENLFRILFGPAIWHYLRVGDKRQDGGLNALGLTLPADLSLALQALLTGPGSRSQYAWTPSAQGFLLRIARNEELLGVVVVEGFAFPEHREQYLNLALSMTSVYALAIKEARAREEIEVERRKSEYVLRESETRLRATLDSALDGVVSIDALGCIIDFNPMAEKIFGWQKHEILGRLIDDIMIPVQHRIAHQQGLAHYLKTRISTIMNRHIERSAIRRDGSEFPIELAITAIRQNDKDLFTAYIRDITQRKQMEEEVRQLAFYDTLTALPNRRLFYDRLNQAMAASKRSACYCALIFLDLDNFKPLNDTHGHETGDVLLSEAADRLKNCVREADTVARFGGDEFVVLVGELTVAQSESTLQAVNIAEKIRGALSLPYRLKIQHGSEAGIIEHYCTASIGVALFVGEQAASEDILNWADAAMYRAKEAGRNRIVCHEFVMSMADRRQCADLA